MEGSFLLITFYFLNKNLIVTIPREEHTYLCINGLSHFTPFIILISKQSNNMMTWVFIAIAFNINKFHVNMLISSSDTRAFSPHILKFYLMDLCYTYQTGNSSNNLGTQIWKQHRTVKRLLNTSSSGDLPFCCCFWMVMGSFGMDSSERDFPLRNSISRSGYYSSR